MQPLERVEKIFAAFAKKPRKGMRISEIAKETGIDIWETKKCIRLIIDIQHFPIDWPVAEIVKETGADIELIRDIHQRQYVDWSFTATWTQVFHLSPPGMWVDWVPTGPP